MRNKRLDILRCVALVTVIIHHSNISPFFLRTGWIGVDLFFVLSGFLISGLLFSEYKKRGVLSFKRFFVRRGFKIYPAFYIFLLLTGLTEYFVLRTYPAFSDYLHDILFIMNYKYGVWRHTWSLGVEEHFYIFLPIFLIALIRFSRNRQDPFRVLPWATLVIALMCIGFRAIEVCVGEPNFDAVFEQTHCRMDSLFFGVLLGYFYHFRPLVLESFLRPAINRVLIAVGSAGLISFAYFFPREDSSRWFATIGFTFIYLGCGGFLLLALYVHGILPKAAAWLTGKLGSLFAAAGVYSYSVYLWHGPFAKWLPGLFRQILHIHIGDTTEFLIYFTGSFAVGILMSKLIEYPILHLRDRIFPEPEAVAVAGEVSVSPGR